MDDESVTLQHVHFLRFAVKQLAKDAFKAKINGVKVLTGSLLGCVGLQYAIAKEASSTWQILYNIGFYTCVYCVVVETFGVANRLATLHRLYCHCVRPQSE